MDNRYTLPESKSQMLGESAVGVTIPVHVATIGHYTKEMLARELTEYANMLVKLDKPLVPYTLEELNARIDEAEAEEGGMPLDEVFSMMEQNRPWLCK